MGNGMGAVSAWPTAQFPQDKLVRWGFVPKRSTIMTDPADYLAFAWRKTKTNPGSRKSEWCRPIAPLAEAIGEVPPRDEMRRRAKQWRRGVFQPLTVVDMDRSSFWAMFDLASESGEVEAYSGRGPLEGGYTHMRVVATVLPS
jgi:hypothetical protein